MSFEKDFQDYPLRIVEMDDFLLNSDDLLHNKQREAEGEFNCTLTANSDDKLTLLFIDSEKYRQHFEKTHLKLKNNIVVLDRYINFQTHEELNQFYQMMLNSKRWLLYGTMKTPAQETETKEMKRKSNPIVDKYSADKNTELLLILNSDDAYVRPILENGFSKLIDSFSNAVRATFEINFENIIKSYWVNKFESVEPIFKLEEIKSNLRPVRFNVMFTAYSSSTRTNRLHTDLSAIDMTGQDKPFTKLSNILSRIKNVISNKKCIADVSNRQNIHTEFSLDLLPSIFYYLSDNKLNLNYVTFNNDQYGRTRRFFNRDESSKRSKSISNNSSNHELANRFQTYVVKSKSKFQNYDKLALTHEPDSSVHQHELLKEDSFCSSIESKLSDLSIEQETTNQKQSSSDSTVNSSISSLSSTISNFINKKKKLTKSTSFNLVYIENEQLIGDQLNNEQKLINLEPTSLDSPVTTFNSDDFNYDYKTRHQMKTNDTNETNNKSFVLDEKIARHPALVKQNLKSKSYDLIEVTHAANNISKSSEAKSNLKPKYRKNSKLTQMQRIVNNSSSEECEVKSTSSSSNTSSNSLNDSNKLKLATVNNYKMRKMSSHKSLMRSAAYAKCRTKSPPPPISLSPNGLLGPPPVPSHATIPSVIAAKVPLFKKSSQAYATSILKAKPNMNDTAPSILHPHSRITVANSQNTENEFNSTINSNNKSPSINLIDLQNYSHLYVKKINSENNTISNSNRNGMAYKNRIQSNMFGQSNLSAMSLKQKTLESNRFRINNYNHLDYNVEKVF